MEEVDKLGLLGDSLNKLRAVASLIPAMDKCDILFGEREYYGLELIITETCDGIENAFWPKREKDQES
jgi:hypothetical protein